MVNSFRLARGHAAQAVYTWSSRLVDGSKGLGFSTISPSLEKSIDWLARLQPTEFKLFKTNNPPPELYEARRNFSVVGRTVRGHISIAYCKTADGTVDVSGRPQPVVHALLADARTFGLLSVNFIRPDFWIQEIEQPSVAGLELEDIVLANVADPTYVLPSHTCPDGHDDARDFLHSLAELGIQGEGDIVVPSYTAAVTQMLLAFPVYIVDEFCHASYVTLEGVQHEIGLRLPRYGKSGTDSLASWSLPETCPMKKATETAATQYLFGSNASIGKYAEAVLRTTAPPEISHVLSPKSATKEAHAPKHRADEVVADKVLSEPSVVLEIIHSIRDVNDNEPFTNKESLELLEKLRQADALSDILEVDVSILLMTFGEVADRNTIWKWSRAWAELEIDDFTDLWNRTHIAAFLGIVLLKNLTPAGELGRKISADRGVSPDVTMQVLQSMRNYPRGGASIGRVIEAGFGGAESTRLFICESFSPWPNYLYDVILESVDLPTSQVIDYIRFGYDSWASYHRLSYKETSALKELLRPKFFDKIKSILGK